MRDPIKKRNLTSVQLDRSAGVLVGLAAGDALGAPFEFGPSLPSSVELSMTGGGVFGWEPGEWTDDTSMAMPIANAAAAGRDLLSESVQDEIVAGWKDWLKSAKDVGVQVGAVLHDADCTAASSRAAAERLHKTRGRSAGNGSLMRTAPVALAFLAAPERLSEAARAISDLTHWEEDAGDACVLWCHAIRHAVLYGELDLRVGVGTLHADRQQVWLARIEIAESSTPDDFTHNGWVVEALQAAWSAITHSDQSGPDGLRLGIEAAVRGGRDTDTVAAIAGSLLGARWGVSALPWEWQRSLHGWPGLRHRDLVRLALLIATGGPSDRRSWPGVTKMDLPGIGSVEPAPHPRDPGVLLGNQRTLHTLPHQVDAVVSLSRVGTEEIPSRIARRDQLSFWLVDDDDPNANPNLDFVLSEASKAVAGLRDEGHVVLIHCVERISRTPALAAAYSVHRGAEPGEALEEILVQLPRAHPKPFLVEALHRLLR